MDAEFVEMLESNARTFAALAAELRAKLADEVSLADRLFLLARGADMDDVDWDDWDAEYLKLTKEYCVKRKLNPKTLEPLDE